MLVRGFESFFERKWHKKSSLKSEATSTTNELHIKTTRSRELIVVVVIIICHFKQQHLDGTGFNLTISPSVSICGQVFKISHTKAMMKWILISMDGHYLIECTFIRRHFRCSCCCCRRCFIELPSEHKHTKRNEIKWDERWNERAGDYIKASLQKRPSKATIKANQQGRNYLWEHWSGYTFYTQPHQGHTCNIRCIM